MKFKVHLKSLDVSVLTPDDLRNVTNNGQHDQLNGQAIVDVRFGAFGADLVLLHPTTPATTGHIDVAVEYRNGTPPIFVDYNRQRVNFSEQTPSWPTGVWSLIQVVLAIETYLEVEAGFPPLLRQNLIHGFCLVSTPTEIPRREM